MTSPRYEDVYALPALLGAWRRARRAHRHQDEEVAFWFALEEHLLALSEALAARSWTPDPYRYFTLRVPKPRVVSAASFRDRVVHHALVGALEPVWEARFIDATFACRRGKGTHAALRWVHAATRRYRYALRLDITRYFENVRHEVLLNQLAAHVPDAGIGWLCATLLEHARVPGVEPAAQRGMPIGNLTSQFWGNVALHEVDHTMTALLGDAGCWARYMDDMVALADDKALLWEVVAAARLHIEQGLGLRLKAAATRVLPVSEGVPWLGWRVFPGLLRLDPAGRRRLARHLRRARRAVDTPYEAQEAARAASVCGHARQGHTTALRRQLLSLDSALRSPS